MVHRKPLLLNKSNLCGFSYYDRYICIQELETKETIIKKQNPDKDPQQTGISSSIQIKRICMLINGQFDISFCSLHLNYIKLLFSKNILGYLRTYFVTKAVNRFYKNTRKLYILNSFLRMLDVQLLSMNYTTLFGWKFRMLLFYYFFLKIYNLWSILIGFIFYFYCIYLQSFLFHRLLRKFEDAASFYLSKTEDFSLWYQSFLYRVS